MHKYESLLGELEARIRDGTLKQGGKLPSIRELARQYGCSNSTAIAALEELERRHLAYSVPRSGYYVVHAKPSSEPASARPIDFVASAPDPALFPYLDFQHCVNKAIDTYKNDLFVYQTEEGLRPLLAILAKQLASSQVFAAERRIVVTSGIQQSLAILAATEFPNGRPGVLIEQPTYHLFISRLLDHRIPVRGIERTAEGIDMEELERQFRSGDIKFFYTIPRFHAPLGTSYTTAQKKQILELARKHDVYVAEDDYMADLETEGKADPLHSLDVHERVIYLKSYSKIVFPGLRAGVAVLPEALVEPFRRVKRMWNIDSPLLSQGALAIYLKSGMFERHRRMIRDSYARRAKVLAEALREEADRCIGAFRYPESKHPAIHTHLVLDGRISVPQVVARLGKRILLERIDKHYLPGTANRHLLKLNATTVREEDIRTGIGLIGEEFRRQLAKS
ncbi:PLP-dependent aminotransferase family protein [Cohnella thailandensis]|uniref:PLP-dependent aminotransferase family protein n=1 Tax=Cohnella thailandensis TaxID=557557 RepID=A0A841SWN8_9BACL|nr:PLP-dependent aminotransferase family protein [Cohnella thailandensis]MBB6634270.1 PLP-dependent aminotransferase family protein [Cohnella thailandensis]MBP1972232.1 DNA-binding transcriptional MocR family regulator [Cohnella thailandensis]